MIANESPPILSRTVALRCFVPADAPKMFAMSREPGVRAWLPDQVYESEAHALDVVRYLIESCRDPGTPSLAHYVLGVCARDLGELIGHVGLSPLDGQVEIGFAVEQGRQREGIASEAVRALAEWALPRFALPRVLAIAATDNVASCKVLEHAGFQLLEETVRSLHGRSGHVRTYERAAARDEASWVERASGPHRA